MQNTPSSSADTATEQSTNVRTPRQTQKSASSRAGNTASLDAQNKEFRRITNTYSKAQVLAAGNKARNNSSDNDNNEGKRNTDNNIVDFTSGATAYAPPTSAVLKDDSHFTLNSFLYFGAVFLIILAFTIYGEIQDSRKYKIEDYDWKEKKKNK
ncbi:hypothetical protein LFYK43_21870 [Ligilactobacillus salitolerans]|uniref:Uncharacterized protein n=1 Tax=Ligilactobacillus salitolerans TaxID=1808352 RepID=A0A401IW41_9LACO|nr:hypothetical protein LFYK43_21870 [Ligilactobacillus salitolerans]